MRRSGVYHEKVKALRSWKRLARPELIAIQQRRLEDLLRHARDHSPYYRRKHAGITGFNLAEVPVLQKEELQEHIEEIVIGDRKRLLTSFTGGTTGKSITVFNDVGSFQERFAILDEFWAVHGYRIGERRCAWFSGRNLIWDQDVEKKRFWRNNILYRVRYYSTFHMNPENLRFYVEDLNRYRPDFMSGFPSAIAELARWIEMNDWSVDFSPSAIFTTSETLTDDQRCMIERTFRCKVRNQYSASEGAPFILECPLGRLHHDLTSGIIEVVDDLLRPSNDGEMLVTPFFNRDTPIIRYRIGDRIKLAAEDKCECGWDTPLVECIQGRSSDYVEVPGRGRVFNAQIGDCVKGVSHVIKFQVEVRDARLQVFLVADRERFEGKDKNHFLKNVQERMGNIDVDLHYVEDIPRARSGKHTLVKQPEPN